MNEMGLNQNRFKASPSENLESDLESALNKANRTKAKAKQNLQKLLIDEKEEKQEEASSTEHNGTGDAMD